MLWSLRLVVLGLLLLVVGGKTLPPMYSGFRVNHWEEGILFAVYGAHMWTLLAE